jgi:NifU-like protein involved in Fe-S cluster formation
MNDPLYRKEILRLAADAAGAGRLARADASATVHNPACGDRVTIEVALNQGRIMAMGQQTHGCVLTQASASLLSAKAEGLDRAALAALAEAVRAMLKGAPPPAPPFTLYSAFEGAAVHAGRHRCVLLPLEAALRALETV